MAAATLCREREKKNILLGRCIAGGNISKRCCSLHFMTSEKNSSAQIKTIKVSVSCCFPPFFLF
jgi:hypothetical protein